MGNVRVVIGDRKLRELDNNNQLTGYTAELKAYNNYYPGGMLQPGRNYNPTESRFGFQGQEKDDEVKGSGNSINYTFRIYDPRTGRFFATDPLFSKYPFYSPYSFSGNRVIDAVELEGLEPSQALSLFYKYTGFTTVQEDELIRKTENAIKVAGRVSGDILIVTGGAFVIVTSGGSATPIVLGTLAVAGGGAKFVFDVQGDFETSDKIPTTASGTVLATVNFVVGEELISEEAIAVVEFAEGVATLNFKGLSNLGKLDDVEKLREAATTLTVVIDAVDVPKNLESIFSSDNLPSGSSSSLDLLVPADNTRVVINPPIIFTETEVEE